MKKIVKENHINAGSQMLLWWAISLCKWCHKNGFYFISTRVGTNIKEHNN